ncbi:MAG: nucleotidyltransferase family protein [Patescibacteria group bacterium]
MVQTVQNIKTMLAPHRAMLAADYDVKRLGIFGSVVHGDATGQSDLDMLVEFTKPIGMFRFLDLEEALSHLLGSKIDLVTPGALKTLIRDEILQETVYV